MVQFISPSVGSFLLRARALNHFTALLRSFCFFSIVVITKFNRSRFRSRAVITRTVGFSCPFLLAQDLNSRFWVVHSAVKGSRSRTCFFLSPPVFNNIKRGDDISITLFESRYFIWPKIAVSFYFNFKVNSFFKFVCGLPYYTKKEFFDSTWLWTELFYTCFFLFKKPVFEWNWKSLENRPLSSGNLSNVRV